MNRNLSQASLAIGYDAYLNDSLLSLVIWDESTYDKTTYYVYNLDLKTGKQLSTADMKSRFSITDDDISTAILTAYTTMYDPENLPEEMLESYQEMYDLCIAPENIAATQIYKDAEGEIFLAANIYSLAGSLYYPALIPLTPTE
jgi:hypothetical protein